MKASGQITQLDATLLPSVVGFKDMKPTLCIGLDIAWFGGSKNDPSSRYDFLAAVLLDSKSNVQDVDYLRVHLNNHDLAARQTAAGLKTLIEKYDSKAERIVLAVDAPLQAVSRRLPARMPIPKKGTVQRRACEEYLNCKRKSIDKSSGGAKGWHPNIQPGAPIAPRVESLLHELESTFQPWTVGNPEIQKLIIECFPAEAIWSAKRMGWFADYLCADDVKAYKKQKGKQLIAQEVTELVETILLPFGKVCRASDWNDQVVAQALKKILKDSDNLWKKNDRYSGGKMLDDVVDSLICLATAISYASGNAHVWQDANNLEDGHIIGPGKMQELNTGKTK